VRCLRKERGQELFHVLALTLGTAWMSVAMRRERLDAIKYMVTVATTIFVGRHEALHIRLRALGKFLLASCRSGTGKAQASLVVRSRLSRGLAA
jgi:hypothetical protein